MAKAEFKLIVRDGESDGFLLYTDGTDWKFIAYDHRNVRTITDMFSMSWQKTFPCMLDAAKYAYGCMRRMPDSKFGLLCLHEETGGHYFKVGDFSSLRAYLMSGASCVDATLVQLIKFTPPQLYGALNHIDTSPVSNPKSLFDSVAAKMKAEAPPVEEVEEASDVEGEIRSVDDFLAKYKHRQGV